MSIARSGITGHVVILCCRFNKCHTVSHSSCIILHCHQQRTRVPVSPHPCQRMLFSGFFFFFTIVMVVDINWCPGSFGEGNGNPFQCSCLEKSHGRRSLVSCSPWGRRESDTTERLHFHFSLSCIGEGNGNPLQCSCLENPRDGGAWWAAVYGSHRVGHD